MTQANGHRKENQWDISGLSANQSDWKVIEHLLPFGWQQAVRSTRALMRTRSIESAGTLLRILPIHLPDGCSLRKIAVRANYARCSSLNAIMMAVLMGVLHLKNTSMTNNLIN